MLCRSRIGMQEAGRLQQRVPERLAITLIGAARQHTGRE